MKKKVLSVSCIAAIVSSVFFFCATPQNPFSDPGNAKISLVFKDSKGNAGAVLAVSDTVGETVKIGVCPYLANLIDSVEVTILKYRNNIDSVYVLKNFSSDLDTLWHGIMFGTIGKWDVSAKSIAHGGKLYMLGGSITIHGKNVSATIQPATETRVVDSIALFTVSSNADTPLTYQWYHDTIPLAGETGASFIKSHITFSDSGKYKCFIHDKWGDSAFSNTASLTVTPKVVIMTNTKPLISISGHSTILSMEICSLTVLATDPDSGQVLTLAVVKGPGGYSFTGNQFVWAPLVGYLGADTVKTDTAIFTVVDNGQPPLSDTAKVAIVVTAKIIPPDSVKGVTAVSRINGSFVFSWNKSKNTDQYSIYRSKDTTGFTLLTTTQDTFFANAIKDTAFYYYMVATNSKGSSAPSMRIHSTIINTAPTWSHNAISVSINEGASFSFNCADSCKDSNGDDIAFSLVSAGSVSDSLVGTTWKYTPSYSDSGLHMVKIKASDGIDSSVLTISVHVVNVPRPPQPQPQNLSTNRNTALVIPLYATVPAGGDPVSQWLIDTQSTHGTSVLSVNSDIGTVTYTPANAFVGTDYFTFKAISGTLSSTYSAKVTIRVDTNNIAPKISQKLSAKTLNKGDSLVLTITINQDAFPAPWYFWYKAGSLLDSTQMNAWKKANLALADSGYYFVIVKNDAGHDSSGAKLTIQMAPAISSKLPATTTVNAGSATPISVTVNSDATPSPGFQWYFNGQSIANATSNSYSKTWAGTDAGTYKVVVSNAAGKDSSNTTLIVNLPPTSPTLVLPVNGAASQPVSLTLTWNKIAIASSYFVQVASDTGFGTVVALDSALTDTVKSVSGLANGVTYYWRVRAKNAVGVSPWSGRRSFTTIRKFALTIATNNGNVATTVGGSSGTSPFDSGTVVTLTATAAANYHFTGWSGGGLSGKTNPSNVTMTGPLNITASFGKDTFTITSSASANGLISPNGTTLVNYGATQVYTISPSAGYKIADVMVDNASVGAVTTYTFSNVIATHTISTTFAIKTYQLIVAPGQGGKINTPTVSPLIVNHGAATSISTSPSVTGYFFFNWTVTSGVATFADSTKATTTVTLTSGNATVRANFIYLGMSFGGGIIFYIDSTGQHGLIAAPSDLPLSNWGCDGTTLIGTNPGMGTGRGNTISIVNSCNVDTIAAVRCYNLTTGGFHDWYLPSQEEVDTLFDHKIDVGNMTDGGYYWSSTETNAANAWADGGYGSSQAWRPLLKTYPQYVRAIRSF
jgi:hypothetical protein